MIDIDTTLIAGPTASGKSVMALELAEKRNGVIINADSMQVYRELKLLTARPGEEDLARAPHRLYGFLSAAEPYSVGNWIDNVAAEIGKVAETGQLPIIVGGTGLYFTALLDGLSPVPDIPPDIRIHWRMMGEKQDAGKLYDILEKKDPAMAARLRPSDPQRIIRALEVYDATGKSLSEWHEEPGEPVLNADYCEKIVVAPERATLYQRCDDRFDKMLEAGALEEVRELQSLNIDRTLPAMRALGVRSLMEYLSGNTTLAEARETAKMETRRYAKRQMTWLKRNMIAWNWQK